MRTVKVKRPIIYMPSGRAGEYANHGYACNLFHGCPHGCLYCFVPQQKKVDRGFFHESVLPQPDVLERLANDVDGKTFNELIFLCFSCDPYPLGVTNTITRQAIEIIKASGNNVRILTKNGEDAMTDFDLLDSKDEFGVTLTVRGADQQAQWEPKAGSAQTRVRALKEAHCRGITTWASLEPVIDTNDTLWFIRAIAPFTDIIKIGKLNYHPHASTIDWAKFARDARDLCESLGVNYVLKNDLKAYLKEGK